MVCCANTWIYKSRCLKVELSVYVQHTAQRQPAYGIYNPVHLQHKHYASADRVIASQIESSNMY